MNFDRSLHRFFLTNVDLMVGRSVDLSPLAHQLHTVLRIATGAHIVLLDGSGAAYLAEIQRVERKRAQGVVLSQCAVTTEPAAQITLYQCSLKADKFEWVLQKGTELGVARFVPIISQRSIVRPAAALRKKYDRWRAIICEAAEQCGRGVLPELLEPMEWSAAIAHPSGPRLLPWEDANRQQQAVGLGAAVHAAASKDPNKAINLLIGPEGGLSETEVAQAQQSGWQTVSLGPRILRAETAALTSITIALDRLNELR